MLQSMGSQRVRHDWVNELNCTEASREGRLKGPRKNPTWSYH